MQFERFSEICEGLSPCFSLARNTRLLVAGDVPLIFEGKCHVASIVGITGLAHTTHIVVTADMPSRGESNAVLGT